MLNVEEIISKANKEIASAKEVKEIEQIRVKYLGKRGQLTEILKNLGFLTKEERPKAGKIVNDAKQKVLAAIEEKKIELENEAIKEQLAGETVDVSLPGKMEHLGSLHPVTKTFMRIENYFSQLGFHSEFGPEIEDVYHNFEALNIPEHHPARAMQDTFYFPDGNILRTHTSPIQIRASRGKEPPIKIIAPGRVYRCDSDVTHTPMFHQIEGFMIDKGITLAHLKGIFANFLKVFFEKDLDSRFRPSYFPFTEPSAEVDMQCTYCLGKGCRICSNTGWLEVAGCGMIHPNVLKNCGVDPEIYSGFAFGLGVDRFAMLRYGINDLRINFENDLKFLQQF